MKYAIIYQSKSGNTRLIAEQIYDTLDTEEKDMIDIDETDEFPEADIYLVGFGIHNYSCSMDVSDIFERIAGKKYALFITCGYMPTEQYKARLMKNLDVWLPDDGECLGTFFSQGNVETDRREIMISQIPAKEKEMKQMFQMGSTHPDEEDLERAVDFTVKIQTEAECVTNE